MNQVPSFCKVPHICMKSVICILNSSLRVFFKQFANIKSPLLTGTICFCHVNYKNHQSNLKENAFLIKLIFGNFKFLEVVGFRAVSLFLVFLSSDIPPWTIYLGSRFKWVGFFVAYLRITEWPRSKICWTLFRRKWGSCVG